MSSQQKRLLTGLQPSGALHLGNYFGALKPFLDLYQDFDSHLMVVDYHALTSLKDAEELRTNTLNIVKDYLAAGVDPKKVILFKQSDVPEHTELAWIFQCLVTVPFLMQAHSYKDKVAKGLEPNAGLFAYPMLMAADILLYDTGDIENPILIPVGKDQQQHIEYAREVVTKFNNAYGQTFAGPEGFFMEGVETVPGIDGQKMSKSYKNTIPLFGSKEEVEKAVMSIVTDSEGMRPENVYAIHKLFRNEEELETLYQEHEGRYGDLKKLLLADIENLLEPMREKRNAITDEHVREVLAAGGQRARERASAKMKEVRAKIGIL